MYEKGSKLDVEYILVIVDGPNKITRKEYKLYGPCYKALKKAIKEDHNAIFLARLGEFAQTKAYNPRTGLMQKI